MTRHAVGWGSVHAPPSLASHVGKMSSLGLRVVLSPPPSDSFGLCPTPKPRWTFAPRQGSLPSACGTFPRPVCPVSRDGGRRGRRFGEGSSPRTPRAWIGRLRVQRLPPRRRPLSVERRMGVAPTRSGRGSATTPLLRPPGRRRMRTAGGRQRSRPSPFWKRGLADMWRRRVQRSLPNSLLAGGRGSPHP